MVELLQNTVNWLNIKQEKPYFYIFHYGHPVNLLTANNSRHTINGKIKKFSTFIPRTKTYILPCLSCGILSA